MDGSPRLRPIEGRGEPHLYEPRCHEGNYGLAGLLVGSRAEELAFEEGRGPHPATKCIAACASEQGRDPLTLR